MLLRFVNHNVMALALTEKKVKTIERNIYIFLLATFVFITLVPVFVEPLPYSPDWLSMADMLGTIGFIAALFGGALAINQLGDGRKLIPRLAAFNFIAFILTTILFISFMVLMSFLPSGALLNTETLTYWDMMFKYCFIPMHLYIVFAGVYLAAHPHELKK